MGFLGERRTIEFIGWKDIVVEIYGCDIGRYIALRKLGHTIGGAKDIIEEGALLQ